MAINKIDMERCCKCGMCELYCPVDVIRIDKMTGEPRIIYLEDCMLCGLCEKGCPSNAIIVTPQKENMAIACWG